MATGLDLIKGALRKIGTHASGQAPTAAEAADALRSMNLMLALWSTQRLIIPNLTIEEFTLTAGQASRTMGTTGNFVTARPLKIQKADIRVGTAPDAIDYPMTIATLEEWLRIPNKQTPSDIPTVLYVEYGYPLATLYFWGAPSAANKVVLYSDKALTQIATTGTTVSVPDGYEEAIEFNLALRLAPEYGRSASAEVLKFASESLAAIKALNIKTPVMDMDPGVTGSSSYNIFKGPS